MSPLQVVVWALQGVVSAEHHAQNAGLARQAQAWARAKKSVFGFERVI